MTCAHPHDPRTKQCRSCAQRARSQEAQRRRHVVLSLLNPGKWVHGEKLWSAAYPNGPRNSTYDLIRRLRRDGYQIEGERKGPASRGFRLIAEPTQ